MKRTRLLKDFEKTVALVLAGAVVPAAALQDLADRVIVTVGQPTRDAIMSHCGNWGCTPHQTYWV